jgi:hypothetical protein
MRELAPDGHQGVLQRVLGETRIAEDSPCNTEKCVADLVHQIGERFVVA